MSRILIESRPVDVAGVDSRFRHIYLVFQPDAGAETVITGGPQHDNPFDFGAIVVDAGGLLADSDVARGNNSPADRGSRAIEVGSRDPADVWALMVQQAANIDDAGEPYEPFSDNSNAVATTVLHAVGIDIAQVLPDDVSPDNAPGLSVEIEFATALTGTARPDLLSGWSGDDTLEGASGGDKIRGFDGADLIRAGLGKDLARGGSGNDVIYGGGGDDDLRGGGGGDALTGGPGADTIRGGAGRDELTGGEGADMLEGGAGSDRFVYQSLTEGQDQIGDFETGRLGDVLDLADLLAGFDPAGSDPGDFVSLSDDGAATTVAVNPDGQGQDALALATLATVTGVGLDQLIADGNLVVSAPTS